MNTTMNQVGDMKLPKAAVAGDVCVRTYESGLVETLICCGDSWCAEGSAWEIEQPKVSKRAIAAAARADRRWKQRGERAPVSVNRSRRGGRGGYTGGGHWTGD